MSDLELHQKIAKDLEEIKGVLLGTYKEKGMIGRVRQLEWLVRTLGIIVMAVTVKIVTGFFI